MTMQDEIGATDTHPQPPASMMQWAIGMRDAYSEGRLRAGAILARIARYERALANDASRPWRADFLRAALGKAFSESGVEGAALRSTIATLVEGGKISPSTAESWAKTFGWPQFTGWADPAKFDPMGEEYWTLPMTAAWIRWHRLDRSGEAYIDDDADKDATKDYWHERDLARVVEQVRRNWDAYIAQSTRWVEVEHSILPDDEQQRLAGDDAECCIRERAKRGYIIAPREDRGWSDLPGEKTETKSILCEALKSDSLKAERYRNGAFEPIPRSEWSALRIVGFHDDDGVHSVIAPDGTEYLAVRVPRKQVMDAFPSPMAEQEDITDARRNVGDAELHRLVEASRRDDGTMPNADDLEAKFISDGLKFGRPNLRRIVRKLTGGRGPGRPPKIRT